MLHSIALGAAVLHRPDYLRAAIANATFILANMKRDGRLLRTYREGQARLNAYLEDYALLADGLIALYEATFDRKWLDEAGDLARQMLELFWDEGQARFYDTGTDHETLIVRPRDITDNAMPSGGSSATDVLLRLSVLTDEPSYSARPPPRSGPCSRTWHACPRASATGSARWTSTCPRLTRLPWSARWTATTRGRC